MLRTDPNPTVDRPWLPVCASLDLPPGAVRTVVSGEREGVVWRGASGVLGAVEAWCPHLGAHLGKGGTVDDDELVCPFHQWRFEPQGGCTALGYPAPAVPPNGRAQAWESRESNGQVQVRQPAEEALPKRGLGQVPSAPGQFPAGWYKVGVSSRIPQGAVTEARYFGRTLRLTRGPDGVLAQFAEGHGPLPSVETGGLVLVWYGGGEPLYAAPDFSAYADPRRSWRLYEEVVSTSLWDVAENPFDVAHLRTVHHLDIDGEARVESDGHSLHLRFDATVALPGPLAAVGRQIHVSTHVESFGLGLTETHIHPQVFAQTWMMGCNTPVDDGTTEYTLIFISEPRGWLPRGARLAHAVTAGTVWWLTEVEREVWSRKQYLGRPCLTRPERGIGRFRKWARQFPCA
ncbi:MAG: phenylpropionate dioxygenase-like ring-hydroxylating dioxygenase large terminal subunit [Myxococcota bacterium]|jgi:phenylpropionate dioxygenase-like ring-hydroxylating dioxygenase large terminal subunit